MRHGGGSCGAGTVLCIVGVVVVIGDVLYVVVVVVAWREGNEGSLLLLSLLLSLLCDCH